MKQKFISLFLAIFTFSAYTSFPIAVSASDLNQASLKEIEEMPMPDYEIQIQETLLPDFLIDALETIQFFLGETPEKYRVPAMMLTQNQLHDQLLQRVENPKKLRQDIKNLTGRTTSVSQLPDIFLKPITSLGQQTVYLARHRKEERIRTKRKDYSGKTVTSCRTFSGKFMESFADKRYPNREGEFEEAVLRNGFH